MRRGEIWTVADGADYTGKPRPAVIVQDDRFDTDSVTVCPFTTDPTEAPLFRLSIPPSPGNGLRDRSCLMVDKLTTVRRSRLGERLGILDDADVFRLYRAMVVFLGMLSSGGWPCCSPRVFTMSGMSGTERVEVRAQPTPAGASASPLAVGHLGLEVHGRVCCQEGPAGGRRRQLRRSGGFGVVR